MHQGRNGSVLITSAGMFCLGLLKDIVGIKLF